MAAFEKKSGPDLDLFVGRSWSDWQNAVESDHDLTNEEKKSSKQNKEVARLKRQDFGLFGFCPAKDDFYLVICGQCHRPVKPQAFCYHVEKYHKDKNKTTSFGHKSSSVADRSSLFSTLSAERSHSASPVLSDTSTAASTKYTHFASKAKTSSQGKASPLTHVNCKGTTSKKRLNNDLSDSPSKVKQMRLDKDPSTLVQKKPPKLKLAPTKPLSDNHQHSSISPETRSSNQPPAKPSLRLKLSLPEHSRKSDLSTTLSNGPVVVLEKSPILEPAKVYSQFQALNSENSSSTSFTLARQHSHNTNSKHDVKIPDHNFKPVHSSGKSSMVQHHDKVAKSKKNSVVKARDYDPNKHCGVWIETEKSHCARSLTCKVHARSSKRKVSGRSKPFDELKIEHLQKKHKIKDKLDAASHRPVSRHNSDSSEKSGLERKTSNSSEQAGGKLVTSSSSLPNTTKVFPSTTPKAKQTMQLFPRSNSICWVDLWQDSSRLEESIKDANQIYASKHPVPLMVCNFGARKMPSNHLCFNRKTDYQWNVMSSVSSSSRKQNYTNVVETGRTSAHFTSIPPVSAPFVTSLKTEKEAILRPRALFGCSTSHAAPTYARTKIAPVFPLRKMFYQNQRLRSTSVPNSLYARSNARALEIQRRRSMIVSKPIPSSSSIRVSMPLDHRLSRDLSSARPGSDIVPSNATQGGLTLTQTNERCNVAFSQACSFQPIKTNHDVKVFSLPGDTVSVKKELPTLNGLSSDVFTRNLPQPTADDLLLEDYIFNDDPTPSESIQLNQVQLPRGHLTRRSQDAIISNNLNPSEAHTSSDVTSNSNQLQELLSGVQKSSNQAFTNRHFRPSKTSSSSIGPNKSYGPNSGMDDNWHPNILSFLGSENDNIRENNFMNFSKEPSNIGEISTGLLKQHFSMLV